jgi:prolipoprotein diacylglyceryl transferase
MLGWVFWDPKSEFFILPVLNLPITWYGLLFALGFWASFQIFYYLVGKEFKEANIEDYKKLAEEFSERFLIYVILATVLGSRLGHVIFYENPIPYFKNPLLILKTWEGGLASHGGVFAVKLSVFIFSKVIEKESKKEKSKFLKISFLSLVDLASISALFLAFMIRLGNFMNQEILGKMTDLPWGIIFGHPRDYSAVVPRHPAQLYEGVFYLCLFFVAFTLWNKKRSIFHPGKMAGIVIFSVFTFRFFVEFIKCEQSAWFDKMGSTFLMGHLLSLPFMILGIYLVFRNKIKAYTESISKMGIFRILDK